VVIWLDIHLSPAIGAWIAETFGVTCVMMRDSGMQRTEDDKAFFAARDSADAILTTDHDFVLLVDKHGAPPGILWLICGNTSNEALRHLFGVRLADALRLVQEGERLVEIG
jgi:predicted nuclease of predicted toxin-antitoxin system